MKLLRGVVYTASSRDASYGQGNQLVSGMCTWSCVISVSFSLFIIISAVRTPLSLAANFSGDNFHPSQVLSSSRSSSLASSGEEDTIHWEEIQEQEVLNYFNRNGRSRNDFNKPSTKFMVSLFNQFQRGGSIIANGTAGTTTDTIRCFSGQKSTTKKKNRLIVEFHIPYLSENEMLRHSEIRFLRNQTNKTGSRKCKFRIDVRKGGKTVRRIVVRGILVPQSQYDVFDVTKIVIPWINGFHGNIILQVRVSKKCQSMAALNDIPLQSASFIALYLKDSAFLTNLYAELTSDDGIIAPSAKTVSKNKRTLSDSYVPFVNASSHVQQPGSSETNFTSRERRNIQKRNRRNRQNKKWSSKSNQKETCQLYDFDVNFNTIGWGQWIIHPKKFNSRFCHGVCPSPIDVQYKPTNHAMLQSLMRRKRPYSAPSPCCVPTKLYPISILSFEYDEIVVRHHEDMVAGECGCR